MTTIKTSKGEFIFVEVPSHSQFHCIQESQLHFQLSPECAPSDPYYHIDIPSCDFRFLFISNSIKEYEASKIVDSIYGPLLNDFIGFKDYEKDEKFCYYEDSVLSFSSMLRKHELHYIYAVLKKVNRK